MCYLDNSIYTAPCIFKNSVQSLGFVITYGEHDSWLEMEKYTLRQLLTDSLKIYRGSF
jgi:hypothetical protein